LVVAIFGLCRILPAESETGATSSPPPTFYPDLDGFIDDQPVGPRTIVVAPDQSFAIQWSAPKGPLWLVPLKNPAAREPLPSVPLSARRWVHTFVGQRKQRTIEPQAVVQNIDSNEIESVPLAFVSPDCNWIFVERAVEGDVQIGYLYHRVDGQFGLAAKERLDMLAWRFFASQLNRPALDIGWDASGDRCQKIDFLDWSHDSARVLVFLSAFIRPPVGAVPWAPTRECIAGFFYFNTRTGQFEITDRLRRATNEWQQKLASIYHFEPGCGCPEYVGQKQLCPAPRTAEAVGEEGLEETADELFNRTDTKLGAVYSALLARLAPPARIELRREEREWLIARDTVAWIRVTQSWSPFVDDKLKEGKAAATEARAADLSRRLSKLTGNLHPPKDLE
jgi:uncharacterized protein YecT (DUF1311 family)